MELTRGTGVALWRQIQKIMEREIATGGFCPGDQLPTEAQLSERFDVNRHTVRRAMQALEAKGQVLVEQGRGSFVAEDVVSYDLSRRVRFSENLLRQSRRPDGEVLGSEVVPVEGRVAQMLRLLPGEPVVRMDMRSRADGKELLVSSHYFPEARFPDMAELYARFMSVTRCFAHYGLADYVRRETRITARMPSTRDAELLGQSRNRPVLVVESVNTDPGGVPVEYGLTRWASDRVEFVVKA